MGDFQTSSNPSNPYDEGEGGLKSTLGGDSPGVENGAEGQERVAGGGNVVDAENLGPLQGHGQ